MNGGSDLTIIVPLWKRTENLPRLLFSTRQTVPDAEVLLVVSRYDLELHQLVEHADDPTLDGFGVVVVDGPGGTRGDYACKINAGYRASTRPLLFTGADDIEFTDGWYEAACTTMQSGPRVGVVGTVDECNARTIAGSHSTHSLVARWYANRGACTDQAHVVYHEGYWHEYCDDELVQVAMIRDCYAHAFGAVVHHHHPNNGEAPMDVTYVRGRQHSRRSRNLYRQRAKLWMHGVDLWPQGA